MVHSHMITLAVVGSKVINVSRETSILAYGLKSNVEELVLFLAHHKLEMRVFSMVTVNLESFFMTVTSLMTYVVFLVQYGLSTEV
jgi:7tm Chemosensory receptor